MIVRMSRGHIEQARYAARGRGNGEDYHILVPCRKKAFPPTAYMNTSTASLEIYEFPLFLYCAVLEYLPGQFQL